MPAQTFITKLSLIGVTLLTMTACPAQTKPTPQQIDDLVARTRANLVFVEGGTFTMGDFGPITREDKLPLTSWPNNKHLHEVTLDSFSLMAYRVTYEDYALYTASKGLPPVEETYAKTMVPELRTIANMPAGVSWDDANGYCQWLGEITGLPMSLPTEAQWEYAARNRGQFVIFPTDNGEYEEGRNFPSYEQRLAFIKPLPDYAAIVYPIGQFPPSPLGFYDMGFGGSEWMKDWYAADYYEHSPARNPQGPEAGTEKVVRGADGSSSASAHTTVNRLHSPINGPSYWDTMIRCAVNAPQPAVR